MRYPFCPQEEKIAGMLKENPWPQDADPALLDHVVTCNRCSEIVFAAEMLHRARTSTILSAPVISPGYLWWRAQLRRRSGVVEKVIRPIVWAEWFALVGMLCIAVGFGFLQRAQLLDLFRTFVGLSMLAGLTAVLCVAGLTLFLSGRRL